MKKGWKLCPHHDGHKPPDLPQVRSPVVLPGHFVRRQRLQAVYVLPRLGELLWEVVPHVPADPPRDQHEEVVAVLRQEARDDAQVAHLHHWHLVMRVTRARAGAEVANHDVPVVHVEVDDTTISGQGGAGCVSGYELLLCWGVDIVGSDEALRGPLVGVGQGDAGSEEA